MDARAGRTLTIGIGLAVVAALVFVVRGLEPRPEAGIATPDGMRSREESAIVGSAPEGSHDGVEAQRVALDPSVRSDAPVGSLRVNPLKGGCSLSVAVRTAGRRAPERIANRVVDSRGTDDRWSRPIDGKDRRESSNTLASCRARARSQ